MHAFEDTRIVL